MSPPVPFPASPAFSRDYDAALWVQLDAHPEALLPQHCALWAQSQGMRVSPSTMSRAIRRPGWTRKKDAGGHRVADEQRQVWHALVRKLAAQRLVFVDESATHTSLTPLYARALKGQRADGTVPRHHGENTTLGAVLSLDGVSAAMTVEGALDTPAFEAYVAHILAPTLRPGQFVVLDNLAIHHKAAVRQVLAAGAAASSSCPPPRPT